MGKMQNPNNSMIEVHGTHGNVNMKMAVAYKGISEPSMSSSRSTTWLWPSHIHPFLRVHEELEESEIKKNKKRKTRPNYSSSMTQDEAFSRY